MILLLGAGRVERSARSEWLALVRSKMEVEEQRSQIHEQQQERDVTQGYLFKQRGKFQTAENSQG